LSSPNLPRSVSPRADQPVLVVRVVGQVRLLLRAMRGGLAFLRVDLPALVPLSLTGIRRAGGSLTGPDGAYLDASLCCQLTDAAAQSLVHHSSSLSILKLRDCAKITTSGVSGFAQITAPLKYLDVRPIDSSVSFGAQSIHGSVSFGPKTIDSSVSFGDTVLESSESFETKSIDSRSRWGRNPLIAVSRLNLHPCIAASRLE